MSRLWSRGVTAALAVLVVLGWLGFNRLLADAGAARAVSAAATLTTLFLSLFLEAVPFLLLGTLASGLVEVYLSPDQVRGWVPRGRVAGLLAAALLGFFFPVGEYGAVVLSRRLLHKGLPPSAGLAFLLAAPVLNPLAIASTLAAFGVGPVLWLRLGLTLLIAVGVGASFAGGRAPANVLRPAALPPVVSASSQAARPTNLGRALTIAVDELFELGAYLVAGALLAALAQTLVPPAGLLSLSAGPVTAVVALLALAVGLALGSAVDAFAALAWAGAFSTGPLLAFLVFGTLVDLKSLPLLLRVFRPRTVAGLVVLPLLITFFAALLYSLSLP